MAMTTEEWIEELKGISVLELAERIKALEETFGVTAAAPVAVAAAPAGGAAEGDGAGAAEEQTSFTVSLDSAGDKKIQVIKVVRAVTGLRSAAAPPRPGPPRRRRSWSTGRPTPSRRASARTRPSRSSRSSRRPARSSR